MKGYGKWSYAPYRPLIWNGGDIYICRVAPKKSCIHIEWIDNGGEYGIFLRERDKGDFALVGSSHSGSFDITDLPENTDFEFYVCCGDKKSAVRLARTGEVCGNVVNYLHPDDEAYSFSGRYLCSPSIVRHDDGYLLASMDVYAHAHPQNLTLIFRSDDDGETWHYVSELMPCFWGKLFMHRGALYMLSVSTEYGDLLIGRSTDGGKTFSAPVSLLRGSNGKNGNDGVHKNPQNIVIYGGRIYGTLEWGSWSNSDFCHAAMVMSCDENDDLLVPENWSFSEPLKYDPNWKGTVNGKANGTIEGTLTVAQNGGLYNIMRYNIVSGEPPYGLVLAYRVNTDDHDAPLAYSHSIKMPCNNSKFMIKYDEVSKKYYSVVTRIDCEKRRYARNLLSLMSSSDLENWELVCDLIDKRDMDQNKVGFQYCDFLFDKDDIIFLCRTADNGANSFHDSNYSTFHRIKNFRSI